MTARPADMYTLELERMCHITSTVSSARARVDQQDDVARDRRS